MYRGRDQGPRGGAEHLARIHGTEEDKVEGDPYPNYSNEDQEVHDR